jgi:hypothetical protein
MDGKGYLRSLGRENPRPTEEAEMDADAQMYLSVHSGLSRTFISDVELGKKGPCLRSLEILADSLGVYRWKN